MPTLSQKEDIVASESLFVSTPQSQTSVTKLKRLQWSKLREVAEESAELQIKFKRWALLATIEFVIFSLLLLIGAAIFQAVEGAAGDEQWARYNSRCLDQQTLIENRTIEQLRSLLQSNLIPPDKLEESLRKIFRPSLNELNACYRRPENADSPGSRLSDFRQALMFAFEISVTMGTGSAWPVTNSGRVAWVVFSIITIPVFWALLSNAEKYLPFVFLVVYLKLHNWWMKRQEEQRQRARLAENPNTLDDIQRTADDVPHFLVSSPWEKGIAREFLGNSILENTAGLVHQPKTLREFIQIMPTWKQQLLPLMVNFLILVIYALSVCAITQAIEHEQAWTFFDAFYYIYSAMALIGLGDYYLSNLDGMITLIPLVMVGIILLAVFFYSVQAMFNHNIKNLTNKILSNIMPGLPPKTIKQGQRIKREFSNIAQRIFTRGASFRDEISPTPSISITYSEGPKS